MRIKNVFQLNTIVILSINDLKLFNYNFPIWRPQRPKGFNWFTCCCAFNALTSDNRGSNSQQVWLIKALP